MPIKQIQLRGISRTPSDRATADGGCAESLNVHLDQQETAPTLPAEDISSRIYRTANVKYPIVYIHKMPGITNYIGNDGIFIYAYGETLNAAGTSLGYLDSGETIKHAASIGNTLILYTDKKPHYYLFKNNDYEILGSEIPVPQLEVLSRMLPRNSSHSAFDGAVKVAEGLQGKTYSEWNDAVSDSGDMHDALIQTMLDLWNIVTMRMNNYRDSGKFNAPVFLRYALRLYDGTYIHQSVPILCGAKKTNDWLELEKGQIRINTSSSSSGGGSHNSGTPSSSSSSSSQPSQYADAIKYVLQCVYEIRIKLASSVEFSSWSDIVKTFDVFISTPIYAPEINAAFEEMDSNSKIWLAGMGTDQREKTIEDAVLSKGNFYLVKSFSLEGKDLTLLTNGKCVIKNMDEDNLVLNEELVDGYRSSIQYLPISEAVNYNNRVLLAGAHETLPTGEPFLNGVATDIVESTHSATRKQFLFVYHIDDPVTGTDHKVFSKGHGSILSGRSQEAGYVSLSSGYEVTQRFATESQGTDPYYYEGKPYSWIAYPDTRCKSVDVWYYENSTNYHYGSFAMKPHPRLMSCAYAFLGYGVELSSALGNAVGGTPSGEDRTLNSPNKIFLSEFENPFLFPAANILTFTDKVNGVAAISAPLSEGQVGDFSIYVFTDGGIRVLVTNAEGTFSASIAHPELSRHVAIPGTIFAMEQAVVFISKRGVMLLSGRDVTELSRNMNGKPYILDSSLGDSESGLLINSEWASLLAPTKAAETLMEFMESAKIAYDHNGARLLFFNPTKGYQYEYRLGTQTWHKLYTEITAPIILNSYPNCYLSYSDGSVNPVPKILDFSTVLNKGQILSDTQNPIKGIIVTRPFDLGEPDIRKAIRSIRVRGYYNRGDVKYVLLGSFDGHNWKLLPSLRGGSYKMFRLVLLTKLTPMERITWIDVDYESRFANRLR